MSKIISRIATVVAALLLLLGGTAQAASAATGAGSASNSMGAGGAAAERENAAATPSTGETRAMIVGGLAFVLMIGTAGAVLWHAARGRHTEE